jgi:hypothetical protein
MMFLPIPRPVPLSTQNTTGASRPEDYNSITPESNQTTNQTTTPTNNQPGQLPIPNRTTTY